MNILIPNSNGEDFQPVPLREDNYCHMPDGKLAPKGQGKCSKQPQQGELFKRPTPIQVSNIHKAVTLILRGKVVELTSVRSVNTVLSKLASIAQEAAKRGKKAPNYDLCQVTVKGTNLFCAESVKTPEYPNGIPRLHMPQLKGHAAPGSPASRLQADERGEVNGAGPFVAHLESLGIRTSRDSVPAASLKASQAELVGPKVAHLMTIKDFRANRIFVSRDNYVVDGHHNWATIVGRDTADGRLGDDKIDVIRIDAPISEVLHLANRWTKKFGIISKPAGNG